MMEKLFLKHAGILQEIMFVGKAKIPLQKKNLLLVIIILQQNVLTIIMQNHAKKMTFVNGFQDMLWEDCLLDTVLMKLKLNLEKYMKITQQDIMTCRELAFL